MSKINQRMNEFGISSEEELSSVVAEARQDRRHKDRFGQIHTPNHIPADERWKNILLSTVLIAYGTYGALHNDIYLPGKRSAGLHFHGTPLWCVYGAMLAASANLLSVVVDHYDTRDNERNYKLFARTTQVLGWGLLISAFALDIFVFHASSKR